jgi:periplasmic protein TonB
MFEELVVSSEKPNRTHKRWAVAVSALAQSALWTILILVPLIYTEALPNGMLKTWIVAPSTPAAVRPGSSLKRPRARIIPLSHITAPRFVPKNVFRDAGGPPVEYTKPGDTGEPANNALIDLFRSPTLPAAPVISARENKAPIPVGGSVEAASLIHRVVPQYPEIARVTHVSGTIVLRAIIAKDGTVQELSYVSGPALLIKPAMDAVRQWSYRPTLLNGKPVEVETTIDVVFTLGS